MEKSPYFVAFDPGGVATGWSVWAENGSWLDFGTAWSHEELQIFLDELPDTVKVFIIEDYKVRNWQFNHDGSRVPTVKAIGRIEACGQRLKAKVILQDRMIKSTAEKWTGKSTKGLAKAKTHSIDAYNHGEYFLLSTGVKDIKL